MAKKIGVYLLRGVLVLVSALTGIYFLGPKPAPPVPVIPNFEKAQTLADLERDLITSEQNVQYIKPENAATIVWADSTRKAKTPVALLYIHGFGASHKEGFPVHQNLAQRFGCNIFLARMAEHGLERGDSNLIDFTAEKYLASAEKALHTARQLGDSVVILATSGGGALALYLASRHPDIKGLLTYSPAIRIFRREAALMPGPWGLQISRWAMGKDHNDWVFKHPDQKKYWTNHQRLEGIIQFSVFLKYMMTEETFKRVKCPFFMAYYYQDEEKQDKTVSVAAMKEMYAQLSTPPQLKREKAFPKADSHVITSNLTTDEWQAVEQESAQFMQEILRMEEKKE